MKWIDDPPENWQRAPEEPPSGRTEHVPLQAERLVNGVVVREPESADAYIYTSEGSVRLDDRV